ncbi:oxygen-independent coproporphyrinogen III oxidase [Pseudoduganella buxea]|uniref:Coproporphyrinogen-III oxidase n=1 Tax=Pseudoduganella buxea TaxID=1949069 RepID=A0A6I3ST98_9BURK|nr:oxygen-independent coproporphyrinogen III oxidase [Pseudoduganella buxea]MTV52368.1 oxygen-independent coproporphyrinogen III oxidase [Pseudoduganella buxea]GGC06443.1 coproporphyrinogen-III oxidase [Pseudoduganella buxea]
MSSTVIPIARSVEFDAALVRKLDRHGPRYTSYPTADRFDAGFGPGAYRQAVAALRGQPGPHALSLYVHIPFCESLCYYCACNKIITQDHGKAVQYLDYLAREIALQAELVAGLGPVTQLHFGGGTPTFLSDAQMDGLLADLRRRFAFAADDAGEFSIEVDPRTVDAARVHTLRRQGFNRISLGVQDFDPDVQRAVNRIQPHAETIAVLDAARAAGFCSISIDLIYGLPRQSVTSIGATLDQVIAARPDRIAVYNYAHMPHLFKAQRLIDPQDMPHAEAKLAMLGVCIERLTAAGYVYIGMDHFALPDDDLARSQASGQLQRNFQGYSTHAAAHMVALGVSAISALGRCYAQNEKSLNAYYDRLDAGELPLARGTALDDDDLLRRDVIGTLMCDFALDFAALAIPGGIPAAQYFAAELERLRPMEEQGLLCMGSRGIKVRPRGRLLIRNICMAFDRYLYAAVPEGPQRPRYSRTI